MSQRLADPIVQTLRSKGLRVTPQRYSIYANLLDRTDHPTAEQLLGDLNQGLPMSSQATVYNSLQALCEAGLVREVLLEHGVSRYDANIGSHHHFVCHQCGVIEDIRWDAFPDLSLNQVRSGLLADAYEVVVRGLCDRCH
ncbi:MAG: transcriptional repressor [Leptolyngbyaceae cyanobacterium SM1_1_3]|nr:transcriptional repressor [Leptolyngbyaceae cyanobacterium SM1_1_3]NJN04227.1 transcriptional repressor [Leptolyngbyaceae cyanobacterium RM1_1_2]NJO11693.1 transcriptional repressor [Leptolyngbyaceae cyanobacterium SL_1_1]